MRHQTPTAFYLCLLATLGVIVASVVSCQRQQTAPTEAPVSALNIHFKDLQWKRMVPELGGRSSEIAILRVDPVTQATQLTIRVPPNFHVPKHWHTANETHTVVNGTFIIECEGQRLELGAGSFNYVPSRMVHEAWTKADEGALLFITVDRAWDVNWVGGPPKPEDFTPGLSS